MHSDLLAAFADDGVDLQDCAVVVREAFPDLEPALDVTEGYEGFGFRLGGH